MNRIIFEEMYVCLCCSTSSLSAGCAAIIDEYNVAMARQPAQTSCSTSFTSCSCKSLAARTGTTADTYWIVCPKATAKVAKIGRFRDWLLAEAADDARRLGRLSDAVAEGDPSLVISRRGRPLNQTIQTLLTVCL
jgi:hypothetical protein